MRVISRFETCGKKMVTVVIGKNVSVMTEKDYNWICNKEKIWCPDNRTPYVILY